MKKSLVEEWAKKLLTAEKTGKPVLQMTKKHPDITIEEAYQIQLAGRKLREKDGRKVVGAKIGLTSKAMQQQFNVYEPDYGYILADMIAFENEPLQMSQLHIPKIEPEIAFVLKDDLKGPDLSIADVLQATEGVMAALEVVDTRYETFTLTVQDSIADIASVGKVVLGGTLVPIGEIDLRLVGMVFEKNGEIISTATGAAVLGHPAASVAWLANKLAEYGVYLKKGDIVISGSLVASTPVEAGDSIRATFDRLGTVGMRFK